MEARLGQSSAFDVLSELPGSPQVERATSLSGKASLPLTEQVPPPLAPLSANFLLYVFTLEKESGPLSPADAVGSPAGLGAARHEVLPSGFTDSGENRCSLLPGNWNQVLGTGPALALAAGGQTLAAH